MTLYLSKIEVDFRTARRLELWDDYNWHKALWQAFPNQPDKRRDFLTRVDRQPEGEAFRAWLLSPEPPQPPAWGRWQFKPVADSFLSHHRYFFSLRANPTKKIVDPAKPKVIRPDGKIHRNKNAMRVPLLQHEELRDWLERKGREQGGFALDESEVTGQPLVVTKEPRHRLRIEEVRGPGGAGPLVNTQPDVRLHSVLFEGVLVVTDREKFKGLFYGRTDPRSPGHIIRGIGSAKGFGFGLLVLDPRPVSQLSMTNNQPTPT